jgi:PPM family protein phosphatase
MLRVVEAAQRTDTGRQREANEDALFARAPVFAVADGMGGAQAGEVASRIAVDAFEPDREEGLGPEEYLRRTIRRANRDIYEHAQQDTSRSGMGTTLTAALISGDDVSFGHVGDSRAYLFRDGELTQLSHDHSLVEELRRQGKLTVEQANEHPQRSVITRALGPEPDVEVDTMTVRGRDDDVFLLCSDGLTTMLPDEDIAAILARSEDLDTATRRLVRAANDRGGKDNITVVAFRTEALAAGEVPDEGATLIGATAVDAGLTAENVRKGRPAPAPREPSAEGGTSRRRWALRGAVAAAVLALLIGGAVLAARQVWFLGTDEAGRVTLYRGLPYELPAGIDLYSEDHSIPVTLGALPEERRAVVVDHELRSRDDAVDLLADLQRAAEQEAADRRAQERRQSQQERRRQRGGGGGGTD